MLKRILLVLIILAATASLPGVLPDLYADDAWTVRTGLNFTPGLAFNRNWDPGYNGTAGTLFLAYQNNDLIFEGGIETGYSYTGLNLLFPLQIGIILAGGEILQLSTTAAILPGLILSRPVPYFLIAAELSARLSWAVNQDFSLSLSAGPRYTTSPAYTATVARLELFDLTIGLTASFGLQL